MGAPLHPPIPRLRARDPPARTAIHDPGSDARLGDWPSREPAPGPMSAPFVPCRGTGEGFPPVRGGDGTHAVPPPPYPHCSLARACETRSDGRPPPRLRRSDRLSAIAGNRGPGPTSALPRRDPGGGSPTGGLGSHPPARVPRYSEKPPEQMKNQWVRGNGDKFVTEATWASPFCQTHSRAGLGFARL
jgi:hypothetical protein